MIGDILSAIIENFPSRHDLKRINKLLRKVMNYLNKMIKKVINILIVFVLYSCSNNSKINSENQKVEFYINEIQLKIDSSVIKCDDILYSIKSGKKNQKISLEELKKLEKRTIDLFSQATLEYKNKTINQESYDKIMRDVFVDSIKSKISQLKKRIEY